MFLSQIPWNYYCILTLIMVITPGSTSTKIGVYEDETLLLSLIHI